MELPQCHFACIFHQAIAAVDVENLDRATAIAPFEIGKAIKLLQAGSLEALDDDALSVLSGTEDM